MAYKNLSTEEKEEFKRKARERYKALPEEEKERRRKLIRDRYRAVRNDPELNEKYMNMKRHWRKSKYWSDPEYREKQLLKSKIYHMTKGGKDED